MSISIEEKRRLRHEWIKFELRKRRVSFSKLASTEGIDRSIFAAVSATKKRSYRAAAAIAVALGTTPSELWPEVYGDRNE